jgi:hypothetical protein
VAAEESDATASDQQEAGSSNSTTPQDAGADGDTVEEGPDEGPGCEPGWTEESSSEMPAQPVGAQYRSSGLTFWYTTFTFTEGYHVSTYTYCSIECVEPVCPPLWSPE